MLRKHIKGVLKNEPTFSDVDPYAETKQVSVSSDYDLNSIEEAGGQQIMAERSFDSDF